MNEASLLPAVALNKDTLRRFVPKLPWIALSVLMVVLAFRVFKGG